MYSAKEYRSLTHDDVRELIRAWREDDNQQAYHLLLKNFIPYVLKQVNKCGDSYKYDVTHKVVVYLAEHLHRFDPDRGNIASWVYWATRHVLTEGAREGRKQQELEDDVHTLTVGDCYVPSASDCASDNEYTKVRQEALEGAMSTLCSKESAMVTRRFIDGLSYEQLAKEFGCVYTTARWRLLRALEKMRPALEDYKEDLR